MTLSGIPHYQSHQRINKFTSRCHLILKLHLNRKEIVILEVYKHPTHFNKQLLHSLLSIQLQKTQSKNTTVYSIMQSSCTVNTIAGAATRVLVVGT